MNSSPPQRLRVSTLHVGRSAGAIAAEDSRAPDKKCPCVLALNHLRAANTLFSSGPPSRVLDTENNDVLALDTVDRDVGVTAQH